MNAFQNIPASQQEEFLRNMEALQRQESARMYNGLVFHCFEECANTFRRCGYDLASLRLFSVDVFSPNQPHTGIVHCLNCDLP